jgi:class 3 adenylate cyclase
VQELPRGTVTFAFTDIEGSTELLKRLGDGYADLLREHRRIIRDTFTASDGVEIDVQGDAFFFVFPRARDAVAAAVEAQRAHATASWPDGATVRVRMGLHTGEPAVHEEGYVGLDVVRAARICTVGRGGQILLSEATRALLGTGIPDGVHVYPRGQRHLRGIDEPERVFEVEIEGLEHVELEPEPEEPVTAAPPAHDVRDLGPRLAEAIQARVFRSLEERVQGVEARAGADERISSADDIAARVESLKQELDERIRAAFEKRDRARGDSSH